MKICLSLARTVIALAALAAGGISSQAQTPLYTANTTPNTVETGTVHFLQVINLAQGAGNYSINSITISVNSTTTTTQGINVFLYSGVDTSATSTNALANATVLGGVTTNYSGSGNFAVPLDLSAKPISFTLTGTAAIGIEIDLLDGAGAYATQQSGRFTDSAPTVGTASGVVYNDANLDNTFTGSEQTTFGMANANIRLALGGTYVAPEPSTWACVALGLAGVLIVARRRRAT